MAVYALRAPHGGLAVGLSFKGRGIWLEREPACHRWRLSRSRVPSSFACGDDDGPPGGGVREPRTPYPGTGSGAVALDPPAF